MEIIYFHFFFEEKKKIRIKEKEIIMLRTVAVPGVPHGKKKREKEFQNNLQRPLLPSSLFRERKVLKVRMLQDLAMLVDS